jgi:hypothetical protein
VFDYPTLGAGAFLASSDRTHELKVSETWRMTRWWSAASTWVVGSGLPTTSVSRDLVWSSGAEQTYQTVFGTKNASRLPRYQRLDVSSELAFRLGATTTTFGVTVFNVADHHNVRYRTYEISGASIVSEDMMFVGRGFNAFARFAF